MCFLATCYPFRTKRFAQRVWFTAPSVPLAYQQHDFLSQQLPAFRFRLITGNDNAEYWKSEEIWDKALHNIQVVVSTPRILLDALDSAFVFMKDISLLVLDEAHHCVGVSDLNLIMARHYTPAHASITSGPGRTLPWVLGLSASPITKKDSKEVGKLEENLNAKCRTPLQQVEEYTDFVRMPQFEVLKFSQNTCSSSKLLTDLQDIVSNVEFKNDPIVSKLRGSGRLHDREKLNKILKKQITPAMKEMESLHRSALDIHTNIGAWACDLFIRMCFQQLQTAMDVANSHRPALDVTMVPPSRNLQFINSSLQPLRQSLNSSYPDTSLEEHLSPKVEELLKFLRREQHLAPRGIIFVKTRHTAQALTNLINNSFINQYYAAFSFVGVSSSAHSSLWDFAELSVQNENLEKFRRGELNLCVATQVLEEGIDVPAVNLVICFDERPNFRSFVQSRGRARQPDSKFVLFWDSTLKTIKWKSLEEEMQLECEKSHQELQKRVAIEDSLEIADDIGTEIHRVPSTGQVTSLLFTMRHSKLTNVAPC